MKKITLILSLIGMSLTFFPNTTIAETPTDNPVAVSLTPAEKAKADAILLRLREIENMDKTNLSAAEKKSLKKEVRSLKHEMKANNNGVYFTIGGLIIIILLLIILL